MGRERNVEELKDRESIAFAMIAARPDSFYLKRYYEEMEYEFVGLKCWGCHSTLLNRDFAIENAENIMVLPYMSWYYPGWSKAGQATLFETDQYNEGKLLGSGARGFLLLGTGVS